MVSPEIQQESLAERIESTSGALPAQPKITGDTVVITGGSQVNIKSQSTNSKLADFLCICEAPVGARYPNMIQLTGEYLPCRGLAEPQRSSLQRMATTW